MRHFFTRSTALQTGLVFALCLLLFFFFRVNSQHSDRHSERINSLLVADELDAELDLIALQILTANLQQYDSPVQLHNTFADLSIQLGSEEGEGLYGTSDDVTQKADQLLSLLRTKLDLLERLKTLSASVRNGLLYLPTLASELDRTSSEPTLNANEFVIGLLSYSNLGSQSSLEELKNKVVVLDNWILQNPENTLAENFRQNLIVTLKGQERLSNSQIKYIAIPSKESLEQLRQTYLNFHKREIDRIELLSAHLLLLCIALVVYLIFILRRLDNAHVEEVKAKNLLHDAIERLSEGFALYDAEGTLRFTNHRWLELYGITDLAEFPQTQSELQAKLPAFVEAEHQRELKENHQLSLIQKTVKGKWLQGTDTPTSDGGLVCIRVDITDHKKAEHRLKLLGSAIEQSPVSIVMTQVDGIIEYVNPKFEQVTGYSFSEVIGKTPRILKSDYTSKAAYTQMWQDLLGGREWRGVFLNTKKDGSHYWESASISPIKDSNGKITHFVAVKEDITQQKQTNDELKMAAAVFEATQEGIMITDKALKITAVNPAFTSITGYSEQDVLGSSPAILSSGKHGPDFYKEMWEILKSEGGWSSEVWNKKKDGSLYPQWLSISVVCDEQGNVSQYIGVISDMSERKSQEERIHYQAYYDALTALPNRTLLMDRIEHDISVAKRIGNLSSLLFVDLDRFKRINDTMGHEVGDRLLVEVAKRLQSLVRESDTISRFGGDEFVILLANISSAESAAKVAEKVIELLNQPFDLNGYDVFTGASVGIAMAPTDSQDPVELLRLADLAMYKAKESGRNQSHFFAREMQERVNRRVVLEHLLRKAVDEDELEVFYQPVVHARTRRVHGVEALVRWFQPEEGNIPPIEFIPVAEESGLITQLGEFVLATACRDIQEIRNNGRSLHLSVNVSSQQYRLGFNAQQIADLLSNSGFSGEHLSLELTESLLFDGDQQVMDWLESIKALNINLSIDDFGTGYSSLSYLKRFPIDTLKIDRAFISDIDQGGDATSLVNAIISMAESLNLNVIAEGVETEEQLDAISNLGCEFIQGYLYAKPMAKEDLIRWLARHDKSALFDGSDNLLQDYTI